MSGLDVSKLSDTEFYSLYHQIKWEYLARNWMWLVIVIIVPVLFGIIYDRYKK